jgi:nucleotide-binding universal stress UspA family protein
MKQILVAVDEHPHAEQIVECAIELAQEMAARVLLIYVVEKTSVPEKYRDEHGDALPEHFYEDEFARTVGKWITVIKKAGVLCEGVPAYGDPIKEILAAAKSRKADYIMMGARELRGLRRLRAISSVSRNVIEKAAIPVIAVP